MSGDDEFDPYQYPSSDEDSPPRRRRRVQPGGAGAQKNTSRTGGAGSGKSLANALLSSGPLISILVDESTSLSKALCLIVYVRTAFDEYVGLVTFFLDLVELETTNADADVLG